MRIGAAVLAIMLAAGAPASAKGGAEPLTLEGPITEGSLVRGATVPGARVTLAGRKLRVTRDGHFVFAFGRDAPGKAVLTVLLPGGRKIIRELRVVQRKYKTQRIKGLPKRKVTPSPEDMKRITAESAVIRAARARYTDGAWYRGKFLWPARGRISGVYGSQRVLNGKPRRPHLGIDVAGPTGTPVVAPVDGKVSLARPEMFFTGNTVMLDHGQGVSSVYAHLSKLLVKEGQMVRRGTRIGLIGATGRVTGPHLHWGVALFGTRVDPYLLTGPMPK